MAISTSLNRGAITSARFYTDDTDSQLDVFQTPQGTVAAAWIGNAEKPGPNEDSAAIIPVDDQHLILAVADGVGGMPAAKRASNVALETVAAALKNMDSGARKLRSVIMDGIEAANQAVLDLGVGAATTLALAEIGPDYIRSYHVGDSVVWLCGQRGKTKLQTTPHSPVCFAMEAGLINESEALHHSELNLIFNVIGSSDMRIEIGSELPMAPRDTLLLASDGLVDNLMQDEIIELMRRGPLDKAIQSLSQLAQHRMMNGNSTMPSKPDDFTTVLFRQTLPRRKTRKHKG